MKKAVTKVTDTLTQEDFHGTVQQVHFSWRRLLRRGLEFRVCTINESAHTKKVWKLIYWSSSFEKCYTSSWSRWCRDSEVIFQGRVSSFALIMQPVKGEENSEFKPIEIDLLSYFACSGGLGKYKHYYRLIFYFINFLNFIFIFTYTHRYNQFWYKIKLVSSQVFYAYKSKYKPWNKLYKKIQRGDPVALWLTGWISIS